MFLKNKKLNLTVRKSENLMMLVQRFLISRKASLQRMRSLIMMLAWKFLRSQKSNLPKRTTLNWMTLI